tara:strand:- start:86810 stop:87013 length:204 start_codon:yes stop_codon:yes gene_type:complete
MDNKQAIDLIEQALELANKKGAFSLNDALVVKQAFEVVKSTISDKEANEAIVKEAPIKESKELKKVK